MSVKSSGSAPPPTNAIQVIIQDKPASLPFGSPAVVLAATVLNDSAQKGVTWTAAIQGGTNCSKDLCGILTPSPAPSFAAAYTAPVAAPPQGTIMVVITATSVSDPTKSDSFALSYGVISMPSLFHGGYSFLLRGFSTAGVPLSLAGVVTADGQGNITGGELDLNLGGAVTKAPAPLTGTYTIDTSFYGSTHGLLTITNFSPIANNQISLRFFLSADGKTGGIIEHDYTGFLASGNIYLQDPSALSAGTPTGPYTFGLDSDAPVGSRTVEIGQFVLGNGTVTSGLVDLSTAGNAAPIYSASAITAGNATAPDSSGRGTLSLTVNGNTVQYVYYISISRNFLLMETDSGAALGTIQAGAALQQQPLSTNSINAVSVLQMTGLGTPGGTQTLGSSVKIGQMQISGGNAFSLIFDSNDLGTILTTQQVSGQASSFDPATGRGVISVPGGFNSAFLDSVVFYLYDSGDGFIIDSETTSGGVANKAFSGTFTSQIGTPIGNSVFSGNIVVLSGASSADSIPSTVAALNVSNTQEALAGLGDLSSLPSQGNYTSKSFSGVYLVTDSTLGHGNATLPVEFFGNFTLNQPAPTTFYVIGPNQAVFIGTLSGTPSGVVFFHP
ncbi:MAG TPA: hypothetical protein VGH37_15480 [Candidatus Acidoferrum sp.]|jgi:hypothetical protein